jgi:hypothetical protein
MRRCPFIALERNKEEQTSAKAGTKRRSIIADSTSDGVGSSNGQHTAASGGYRFFFRLLAGGLLVRIQPEEPNPFSASIYAVARFHCGTSTLKFEQLLLHQRVSRIFLGHRPPLVNNSSRSYSRFSTGNRYVLVGLPRSTVRHASRAELIVCQSGLRRML